MLAQTEPCIACDGAIMWHDKQNREVIVVIVAKEIRVQKA